MHSSLILAQAIPPGTSLGEWLVGAMGTFFSLMVLASGLLIFAGSWYLVSTGKRPAAFAAYLVLLPLPVLIAICSCMSGMVSSLTVIASTPGISLSTEDVAAGVASSLAMVLYAILVSAPTYFVLAFGLLTRTLRSAGDGVPPAAIRSEPHKPLLSSGGPMPATT
jgi:hypothetical protein